MERLAEYLRRAEDAERLARAISFQPDKQALLDIAAQWRRLADERRRDLAKKSDVES